MTSPQQTAQIKTWFGQRLPAMLTLLRRLVEGDREPLTKDGLQRLVESLSGDSMDSFFGSLPD